jgi:transporter family-2 protein
MTALFIVLAVVIGSLNVIQASINGQVRLRVGDAWHAALLSTSISTISLLMVATLVTREPLPSLGDVARGPWWLWTGGLLGAAYVAVALVAVNRLGSAVLYALIVFGQLMTAVAMDHYGVLGLPRHEITPVRVAGVLMLLGGMVLIRLR